MTDYVHCHYLKAHTLQRCTGEVVDPDGEVLLCTRHLGLALELVQHSIAAGRAKSTTPEVQR